MRKILFLVFIVFLFSFLGTEKINASGNVYGWAWTENIGWISFNNDNGGFTGIPAGGGSVDYGVHICESDTDPNQYCSEIATPKIGKIVGYAWSENIGWIKFNPASDLTTYPGCGFPASPCNGAKVDLSEANHLLSGWARACSVFESSCSGTLDSNRGGWDGWIRMQDNAYIDSAFNPAQFRNWVWGGNPDNDVNKSVIGWGTFNCLEGGANRESVCVNSNYKVVTTFPFTPLVLPPEITQVEDIDNRPLSSDPLTDSTFYTDWCSEDIYFGWTYIDNNTPPSLETEYQLQVDNNSNFNSPVVYIDQTGLSNPSGTVNTRSVKVSAIPLPGQLAYNTTYYWRVKVFNDQGKDSGWQGSKTSTFFQTPKHRYPIASFSYTPPSPVTLVNNSANFDFTDASTCYNDSNQPLPSCTSFSWSFDGVINSNRNPSYTYNSQGQKKITLTVYDSNIPPYSCSTSQDIQIKSPKRTPKWWEISPFW
jgi:hypothetical protein